MNHYILIPAYKPEENMLPFISALKDINKNIIVVDDGGKEAFAHIFDSIRQMGITVLTHPENRGKGAALKTGIAYIAQSFPDCDGIITADCDGQHAIEDIIKVSNALKEHPDGLIIGGRALRENVPLRSRFGNWAMRNLYRLASGYKVRDTQTGLRAIPSFLFDKILALKGDRYELEMNMLLYLKKWGVKPIEVEIQTIYINDNAGSHFDPLKDSARIMKHILAFLLRSCLQLIKYVASSLTGFLIDWLLCLLLVNILPAFSFNFLMFSGVNGKVFFSSVIARIISSLVNYTINKKIVFGNKGRNTLIKYTVLVIAVMILSSSATTALTQVVSATGVNETAALAIVKPVVDTLLFIMNYFIQKKLIFKNRGEDNQ